MAEEPNYYIFIRGNSTAVGEYDTIQEAKQGMAVLRNQDDRKEYVCRDVMGKIVDVDH